MRRRPVFVVLLAALALAGCARARPAMDARAQGSYSELDYRMYGVPGQPSSYVVRTPARVTTYTTAPAYSTPVDSAPAYTVPAQPSSGFFAFLRKVQPSYSRSYTVASSYTVREAVPVAVEFEDGPYTLDAGDKLRIVVFGQDALSNNYIVDAEGRISFPLVGTVNARGATTSQLAATIRSQLSQGFIRDPSVAVEVETYRPFFVLGEVTYPGQYPYVPNMTVENAIAIAGGFTPRGFKDKVAVTRKIAGMPTRLMLPLRNPVRPGDTITVTERWF